MDSGIYWTAVSLLALGSFGLRLSFIQALGKVDLPGELLKLLRFIPAAVLPAIIFPAVFFSESKVASEFVHEGVIAALIAALAAGRSKNMLLTVVAGMASLWALRTVLT